MKKTTNNKQHQVPVLNEQQVRALLSENTKWKTEEEWWTGSSERFANAPFGYDVNIFDAVIDETLKSGEFKAIVYLSVLNEDNVITVQTQNPLFEFKFHESEISYTPAENKEPLSCVKCGSCDIPAELFVTYDEGNPRRTVTCAECGTSWEEFFIFDRWELE